MMMNFLADDIDVVFVKPDWTKPQGERTAQAINVAASRVNMSDFDYILRTDADAILPNDFLEKNIALGADCATEGAYGSGYGMLLKVSAFEKALNGRFAEVSAEDSYTVYMLRYRGFSIKALASVARLNRQPGETHSYRYQWERGVAAYKVGYEPIHMISLIRSSSKNLITIFSYFLAALKQEKKYEFAGWVFKQQINNLVRIRQPDDS